MAGTPPAAGRVRMRAQATQIIAGHDAAVAEWARRHFGVRVEWGPCAAIGIARGGDLIAGIVFNNFRWPSIEASIASTRPDWASRRNLAAIFAYPFRQLDCRRVGALTEVTNQPVRAFLCRLGFQEEGVLRDALVSGDAVIFGMTRAECRWLPAAANSGQRMSSDERWGGNPASD